MGSRKANIGALVLFLALFSFSVSAQSQDAFPPSGTIRVIEFNGLQRISAATLRGKIGSREGQTLDPAQVAADVRALNALGWFENIRTEAEQLPLLLASATPAEMQLPRGPGVRLIFTFQERPFLAKVEFRGSRVLQRERIEALLAARGIRLKLAVPANPTEFFRARRAIEDALADAGYPHAQVLVRRTEVPRASVHVAFRIHDGPRVHVTQVEFEGNLAFDQETLQGQLVRVAPGAVLAGKRGKTIYTPARLAEDLEAIKRFYRDHGFPDVKIETPRVVSRVESGRQPLPWPHRVSREALHITIPIDEGAKFQIAEVSLEEAPARLEAFLRPALADLKTPAPYSEKALTEMQERLQTVATRASRKSRTRATVELTPAFDREAQTVRVAFRVREAEPYTVRRIEFTGHHRFADRYYRRRIGLVENEPFDAEKLERGLAQLARAGLIRPATRDDIHIQFNEELHTADVRIHVEELGRQRVSLVGGATGLTNSLGLAYSVFDLLGGEEMITTHLEGGPGNLSALIGIAKDSLFGSNASLGLNLFHNVLKPRLPGTHGRERLFTSRNSGLQLSSGIPFGTNSSVALGYERSLNTSSTLVPAVLTGVPAASIETHNTRRAASLAFSRETGRESFTAGASVSGGWLGGDERLVNASLEYARIHPDPMTHGRNAWAWRGYLAGVSSYHGQSLLLHQRHFAGEQLVRGYRQGELAPYTEVSDGLGGVMARSGGSNLVTALNAEYRVPLEAGRHKAEGALFLDAGAGWLLPQWLGPQGSRVVPGTNGLLRASAGLEVRVHLPVLNQPLRVNYAVNPLRLAQALLSDGRAFQPPNRRASLGWALGPFF